MIENATHSILPQLESTRPQLEGVSFFHHQPRFYGGLVVAWVLLLVSISSLRPSKGRQLLSHIPSFPAPMWKWLFGYENILTEGSQHFGDHMFKVAGPEGVKIILPLKYVPEVKSLPVTTFSAEVETNEVLQTKYTGFPLQTFSRDLMINTIRTGLSSGRILSVVPQLASELEYLMEQDFPSCSDWTPLKWQPFALRAISRLSGYLFVGPAISRLEQWTTTSIDFAMYVFVAAAKLQLFPQWARPFARYIIGEVGKIDGCIKVGVECLEPVLDEMKTLDNIDEKPALGPGAFIGTFLGKFPEGHKWDPRAHAESQLAMAAASVHTTGQILSECMYDLASDAELQQELREEAEEVLLRSGGWENKEASTLLVKMDSFMKEVQRLRGNMASLRRRVMKPVTFNDGSYLPAGTSILCSQTAFSLDERNYTDPQTFDPMRFYKLRTEATTDAESNRQQFTSTCDANMHFGISKHSCPGRFLANTMIKVTLAHFLLNYEVRLQPGASRPKSWTIVMTKSPDPRVVLEFRKRPLAA